MALPRYARKYPLTRNAVAVLDLTRHVRLVEPDHLHVARGVADDGLRRLHLLPAPESPPPDAPHRPDDGLLPRAVQLRHRRDRQVPRRIVPQQSVDGRDAEVPQLVRDARPDAPHNRRRRVQRRGRGRRRKPSRRPRPRRLPLPPLAGEGWDGGSPRRPRRRVLTQRRQRLVHPPLAQFRREVVVSPLRQRGRQARRQRVGLLLRQLGAPPVEEPPQSAHHRAVVEPAPRLEFQHAPEIAQPLSERGGRLGRHGAPRSKYAALSHRGAGRFQRVEAKNSCHTAVAEQRSCRVRLFLKEALPMGVFSVPVQVSNLEGLKQQRMKATAPPAVGVDTSKGRQNYRVFLARMLSDRQRLW